MIKIITLALPLHMGFLNCYLLPVSGGFILITKAVQPLADSSTRNLKAPAAAQIRSS